MTLETLTRESSTFCNNPIQVRTESLTWGGKAKHRHLPAKAPSATPAPGETAICARQSNDILSDVAALMQRNQEAAVEETVCEILSSS